MNSNVPVHSERSVPSTAAIVPLLRRHFGLAVTVERALEPSCDVRVGPAGPDRTAPRGNAAGRLCRCSSTPTLALARRCERGKAERGRVGSVTHARRSASDFPRCGAMEAALGTSRNPAWQGGSVRAAHRSSCRGWSAVLGWPSWRWKVRSSSGRARRVCATPRRRGRAGPRPARGVPGGGAVRTRSGRRRRRVRAGGLLALGIDAHSLRTPRAEHEQFALLRRVRKTQTAVNRLLVTTFVDEVGGAGEGGAERYRHRWNAVALDGNGWERTLRASLRGARDASTATGRPTAATALQIAALFDRVDGALQDREYREVAVAYYSRRGLGRRFEAPDHWRRCTRAIDARARTFAERHRLGSNARCRTSRSTAGQKLGGRVSAANPAVNAVQGSSARFPSLGNRGRGGSRLRSEPTSSGAGVLAGGAGEATAQHVGVENSGIDRNAGQAAGELLGECGGEAFDGPLAGAVIQRPRVRSIVPNRKLKCANTPRPASIIAGANARTDVEAAEDVDAHDLLEFLGAGTCQVGALRWMTPALLMTRSGGPRLFPDALAPGGDLIAIARCRRRPVPQRGAPIIRRGARRRG